MKAIPKVGQLVALTVAMHIASASGPIADEGEISILPGETIHFELASSVFGKIVPAVRVRDPSRYYPAVKVTWTQVDGRPAIRLETKTDRGVGFVARVCNADQACETSRLMTVWKEAGTGFPLPGNTQNVVLGELRWMRKTNMPLPQPAP